MSVFFLLLKWLVLNRDDLEQILHNLKQNTNDGIKLIT